jgi:glycosyltransferase involved in cell wall biosynthesis
MKPIALFVPSLSGGGAEKMTLHLAGEFVRLGYPVDLLLVRNRGEYQNKVPEGVRVVVLGPHYLVACVVPLARYLRERGPAVLLSALTLANCVAIGARLLARSPARVLVSERNHLTTATRSTKRLTLRLLPLMARFLYPLADVVVGISKGVVEDLRHIAPAIREERLHVVYNPVITDGQISFQRPARMPHPWLEAKNVPVILAVGRLVPQKDFKTLLRGFAILRARRPMRLVILGEGPDRGELLAAAECLGVADDVLLPGFVSQPMEWYLGASVFALSSAWEGFGNVIVEALFAGLPVVSTNCCSGPAEILENGKYGRLVPVGDAVALANALDATLDKPPEKTLLQKRARDFNVSNIAIHYLRVALGPFEINSSRGIVAENE